MRSLRRAALVFSAAEASRGSEQLSRYGIADARERRPQRVIVIVDVVAALGLAHREVIGRPPGRLLATLRT